MSKFTIKDNVYQLKYRTDNIPEDKTENAAVIMEHSQIRIIRILIFSHLYHFGWTGRNTSNKRSIEINFGHILMILSVNP